MVKGTVFTFEDYKLKDYGFRNIYHYCYYKTKDSNMKIDLPELSYKDAKETYETLQLWTQIIGKIKLVQLPWINHSWHVILFVNSTGLTTFNIPDRKEHFEIDFDFINHVLKITTHTGQIRQFELKGISVAGFYKKVFNALAAMEIEVKINPLPNEIVNVVPFYRDDIHFNYNVEQTAAFHTALLFVQDILTEFRSGFIGKCSPVHFF